MNRSAIYIRHTDDVDHTVVTLYTFIKYVPDFTGKVFIIAEDLPVDIVNIINDIYANVTIIKPGAECKNMLIEYKDVLDVTGKIFEHPPIPDDVDVDDWKPKIAVVAYVFYTEYYQEIYNHVVKLSNSLKIDIDLHVYLCDINSVSTGQQILTNQDRGSNVNVILNWTANKGRDVRSFLNFIKNKTYKGYDLICKVHTKKTTYLHDNWREVYLDRLLSPDSYKQHVDNFSKNGVQISSVTKFEIHEKHVNINNNYESLRQLCSELKVKLNHMGRYKFHAGTMFWCTSKFCEKIDNSIDLKTHVETFPNEPIKNDGTLAHAWERVFWLL